MNNPGDDITRAYDRFVESALRDVKKKVKAAESVAWEEYVGKAEAKIREIFNRAIDDFYADYTPRGEDAYDRQKSLYNLLKIEVVKGERGSELTAEFIPENMSTYRSGFVSHPIADENKKYNRTLYDDVFRHGWHGGADRGKDHPSPGHSEDTHDGVPYWRIPVPHYNVWSKYKNDKGEDGARILRPSPLERINEEFDKFKRLENDNLYRGIFERELSKRGLTFKRR